MQADSEQDNSITKRTTDSLQTYSNKITAYQEVNGLS
jgi:hypothetical protein